MPVDSILVVTLLAIALVANVVLAFALVRSFMGTMRSSTGPPPLFMDSARLARHEGRIPGVTQIDLESVLAGSGATFAADRVVRVVSWALILSVAVIVAVTHLWRDNEEAIFVVLALAGVGVLVVHDLVPRGRFGPIRFLVEGSGALAIVSALVLLTGAAASPFFFLYALVVAGEALVASPAVTVILTAVAGVAYVAVVTLDPLSPFPSQTQLAEIGINLSALCLLTYAAMVVATEQRRQRDAAVRLSTIDSLTELHNRAYFFNVLEREIQRSGRFGRGFCLLMMDLDGLKATNDRYGHFLGDRVLRGAAAVIRAGLRGIDTAARYGGDEFVVLLPETDPTGAYVVAEKIRQGVADLVVDAGGREVRTSLSIGVVAFPHDGQTADELMITADRAMYGSKRLGKNQVVGFADPAFVAEARDGGRRAAEGDFGRMEAARQTESPAGEGWPRT